MQLPDSVKAIRARYVAQFPVPQGQPGEAFEDSARQWSIRFAEQVAFELGPMWGMKRADPNRPISKDTLSYYADDTIRIWDLLTGTGTGTPRLVEHPESEDITGQVFVPVTPTNHLGATSPDVPSVPPPVVVQRVDLGPVLALLEALGARMTSLDGRVQAQVETVTALGGQLSAVSGQIDGLGQQLAQKRKGTVRAFGRTIGDIEL